MLHDCTGHTPRTLPSTKDDDGRPRTRVPPSLVTIIIFLFSFRHILFIFCWTFCFGFYICSTTTRSTFIIRSCSTRTTTTTITARHIRTERTPYTTQLPSPLTRHSTVRNIICRCCWLGWRIHISVSIDGCVNVYERVGVFVLYLRYILLFLLGNCFYFKSYATPSDGH